MIKGKRAADTPIGINVLEGNSYYWCACGLSKKQPFCDGSHKETTFKPLLFKADQSKKIFFALANKLMISQCVMDHIMLNNFYEKY